MARIFQASTLFALESGNYDYTISLEYFMKNGNFGVGTYNGLNGEAIFLDGVAYNATGSGNVKIMDIPQTGITFGQIVPFDKTVPDETVLSFKDLPELEEKLASLFPRGKNYFYAICAHALFDTITVRSGYKQRKPFRPFDIVASEMRQYSYNKIPGTLIGFFSPDYSKGLSEVGFHFHFLDDAHKVGGHVLALSGSDLKVKINLIDKYEIKFPVNKEFIALFGNAPVEKPSETKEMKEEEKKAEEAKAEAEAAKPAPAPKAK